MSVTRPARSVLLARCLAPARTAARVVPCRQQLQFHSSAPRPTRKPRYRSVKAREMGLLEPEDKAKYLAEKFPDYTPEQVEELKKDYTPQQWEAFEAGEKAVDPEDLAGQGRLRMDPYRPNYIEDYRVLDPRYDVKPPAEGKIEEVRWKDDNEWIDDYGMKMAKLLDIKTDKQLTRAMIRAIRKVKAGVGSDLIDLTEDELKDMEEDPELLKKYLVHSSEKEPSNDADADLDPSSPDVITREQAIRLDKAVDKQWKQELEALENFGNDVEASPTALELIEDGPAGPIGLHTVEQPELGKVPGVEGLYDTATELEEKEQDATGEYEEVKRVTGMTLQEIKSILTKSLVTRFVHNQTRLGKIRSISIMAIAGNGDGRLGIGMAKSTQPEIALMAARLLAIRNMKPIRRYENRTIFGNVKAKVSGTVVELFARPPGFGLRVPHRMFEMCRACGIHDLAAKMPRSKNPMNSVKATYNALMGQPDPEAMAIGRGKKLVDVRKVYYGGSVL